MNGYNKYFNNRIFNTGFFRSIIQQYIKGK